MYRKVMILSIVIYFSICNNYITIDEFNNSRRLYEIAIETIVKKYTSSFIKSTGKQTVYDVVPIERRFDEFGAWELDRLFNQMKIFLVLSHNDKDKKCFPELWRTDAKVWKYTNIFI